MDLSALGQQPISIDQPAGADVRYDPAYDELQTEVDKLSSPAAAGSVDWHKVAGLAADILTNKSKDLLVASYLAVALIHTRRNEGFTVGLTVYLELIEQFWEELHPQKIRMRGRVRALEWWREKTEAALIQVDDLSFSPDQLDLIKENLNRLDNFLAAHLENSPSLAPIREYFHNLSPLADETEETEATVAVFQETVEMEPAMAAVRQPEPQALARLGGAAPLQEAGKALSDGLMKISEASFYIRQNDPASPRAYRLTRNLAWHAVSELPQAAEGRTKIPPPPSQLKNLLLDLLNNGDAEALLQAAETRLPEFVFWIDLSRMAAEALARLGTRFDSAHDAVCQETAFLLHRLPGLEELSFADGTPFATPETRHWLKRIAFREAPSDASPLSAADSVADAETEAVIEREMGDLQQLVREGKLIEAMEMVQRKLGACSSRRVNLLWRLSLSRMLVDLDKSALALPHLEQVLNDIASHGLERYDPSLALRGFKLAWLAFNSRTEQKFKDRAQEVLHLIGRLDMPEMVRLIKG